jgi:hypothetical protein
MSVTLRLAPAMLALAGIACGSNGQGACKLPADCADGFACVNNTCIPRSSGRNLGVEILPPSDSISAATELPMLSLTGQSIQVVADDKISVLGAVTFPAPTSAAVYPSHEAHVVVTIPSLIASRDDLQIATEMAMAQFTFVVPKQRLEVTANLRFIPGSAAQTQPPIPLAAPLAAMLTLDFPGPEVMTKINGKLVLADGSPAGGYVARASVQSVQSVQISNAVTLSDDGSFGLLVPPDAIPLGSPDLVSLSFTPVSTSPSGEPPNLPQLVTTPTSLATLASTNAATPPIVFTMPDFLQPQLFQLLVTANGEPQNGVTAHFHTEIASMPGATAIFEATAVSNDLGLIEVSLIPGTAAEPRTYAVAVEVPPDPKYNYAPVCIPNLVVNVGDDGTALPLPPVTLTQRFQLSGSVSDSKAAPAVGATVKATQMATGGGDATCGGGASTPSFSTITDANGNYFLLVDPGTYQLDVDPPAMAAWPRLTDATGVTVSHPTVYPISLPAGQAIEGTVVASDMVTPLGLAKITIFQVFCDSPPCGGSPPPIVLAQTQSDANGAFATVLPLPLP